MAFSNDSSLPQPGRITVLLTSTGARVSLLRIMRQVGQQGGLDLRIVACDRNPRSSPASLLADAAYQTPSSADPGYIRALVEICLVHRVSLILPMASEELPILTENRDQFEAVGAHLFACGAESVAVASDADRTAKFVRDMVASESLHELINVERSKPRGAIGERVPETPLVQSADNSDAGRSFDVLMYFDRSGRLGATIPCERLQDNGVERVITRKCPKLEAVARQLAENLSDPRSLVSFDATFCEDGRVAIERIRLNFADSFEIAHRAGAKVVQWLIDEHLGGDRRGSDDWAAGVEMLRYSASMFVLPS